MTNEINIEDILTTPFSMNLEINQGYISKDFTKRIGYEEGKNNHHLLTTEEKKVTRIFRLESDLLTMLNDIKSLQHFIKRFPDKKHLEKNDISELDYIRYHYEVFIHKVHTVGEIMKLLANEVLDLRIPVRNCNWKNLIKKQKFLDSKYKEILEKNYSDFNHLIYDRNLNTHRGIFDDQEMNELSPLYFILRWHKKNNTTFEKEDGSRLYMTYKIKELKKNKLKEIKDYENTLINNVYNFFLHLNVFVI